MTAAGAIQFRIDRRSGVATYWQIVQQTKQALRLGLLQPGDKLPTAREVVEATAINPNTFRVPRVGRRRPAARRRRVDLPAPFGPTRAHMCPWGSRKEQSSRTADFRRE